MAEEGSRQLHNWDEAVPWRYVLDGDDLRVEYLEISGETRFAMRRATDAEGARALYLQLADAVERRNGQARLRRDYRQRILDLANLYAPPVDWTSFVPGDTFPIRLLGQEALLVWWTVRLGNQLRSPDSKEALDEALVAVTQIREMLPVVSGDGVTSFLPAVWQTILASMPPRWKEPGPLYTISRRNRTGLVAICQVYEVREAENIRSALRLRQFTVHRPETGPVTATRTASLPTREVQRRVAKLRQKHHEDPKELWALGSNTLASVLNVKLHGAMLACLPMPGTRRPLLPAVAYHFLTPLARIWFRAWQDLTGFETRVCPRCGGHFQPKRKASRFCGQCRNAANTQASRERARARAAEAQRTPPKHGQ